MSVAALQRSWLSRLERLTDRPILAQTHKLDPWLPWRFLNPNAVIWTRSLLENELLFETDNPDKAFNESCARRLAFALTLLGAKPLIADGGGKSWHVHVWIDPDTALDPDVLDKAEAAGVDIWQVVRTTLYDQVVELADLPKGAKLDRAKVAWSKDKLGSMVREFGTPGSTGARKTLVGGMSMTVFDHFEVRDMHPVLSLATTNFPKGDPPLWQPPTLAVEKALTRATNRKSKSSGSGNISESLQPGNFLGHPCVVKALSVGAPAGERNATGLHLLRLARSEGVAEHDARAALAQYLAASGCDLNDKLVGRVSAIYAEAPSPIACPNPMRLSVCDGVGVCPRRAFSLGA